MYSDNNVHARGGHIVKVVNVFGMFKCKHRHLKSVDWGRNGTHVVWHEMILLEIDYIDLLLMGAKDLNATLEEMESPIEGTVGEGAGGGWGG